MSDATLPRSAGFISHIYLGKQRPFKTASRWLEELSVYHRKRTTRILYYHLSQLETAQAFFWSEVTLDVCLCPLENCDVRAFFPQTSCRSLSSSVVFKDRLQQSLLAFVTTVRMLNGSSILRPAENDSGWSMARWMSVLSSRILEIS